jgi:hypothetical protein
LIVEGRRGEMSGFEFLGIKFEVDNNMFGFF